MDTNSLVHAIGPERWLLVILASVRDHLGDRPEHDTPDPLGASIARRRLGRRHRATRADLPAAVLVDVVVDEFRAVVGVPLVDGAGYLGVA